MNDYCMRIGSLVILKEIVIHDPDPTSNATVTLPLSLSGVTSYLPVHKTSLEDWDSGKYPDMN